MLRLNKCNNDDLFGLFLLTILCKLHHVVNADTHLRGANGKFTPYLSNFKQEEMNYNTSQGDLDKLNSNWSPIWAKDTVGHQMATYQFTQPGTGDYHYFPSGSQKHDRFITQSISYPPLTTKPPLFFRPLRGRPPRRPMNQQHPFRLRPPTTIIKTDDYNDISEEIDTDDLIPLSTITGGHRTLPSHSSNRGHYLTFAHRPASRFPTGPVTGFSSSASGFGSSSQGENMGFLSSLGASFGDGYDSNRFTGAGYPIITEVRPQPLFDLKNLGIMALVKIGLAKLKVFGLLKIIFLLIFKLKLFLIAMFVKFVLFLKALKYLKALLIPLLLLALLPLLLLLLLPLLLLPLLLPLLLFLPVPIPSLAPAGFAGLLAGGTSTSSAQGQGPGRPAGGNARIAVLDFLKMQKDDPVSEILRHLLESEDCVERIACQLATKREAKFFAPLFNWYLGKLDKYAHNEKISAYVKAYLNTNKEYKGSYSEQDGIEWCREKHPCNQTDVFTFEPTTM